MANGWAPFIGAIVVLAFCAASWFLAPKGENQTYAHPSAPVRQRYHCMIES